MIIVGYESRLDQLRPLFPSKHAPPDVLDRRDNLVVTQPARPAFAISTLRGRLRDSIQDPLAGRRYQHEQDHRYRAPFRYSRDVEAWLGNFGDTEPEAAAFADRD